MILQSISGHSSCSGSNPFNVPCVPTGMNTGVSTTAWGNVILQDRAFDVEHFAIKVNFSASDVFILTYNGGCQLNKSTNLKGICFYHSSEK